MKTENLQVFNKGLPSPNYNVRSLKFISTNLDGISNKRAELSNLIYTHKPDIICLTETKTSPKDANDHFYDTDFFEIFRKDRSNVETRGGGVTILVRKSLNVSDLSVNILNNHEFEESIWCEIKCGGKPIIVGTVYRPENSSKLQMWNANSPLSVYLLIYERKFLKKQSNHSP